MPVPHKSGTCKGYGGLWNMLVSYKCNPIETASMHNYDDLVHTVITENAIYMA